MAKLSKKKIEQSAPRRPARNDLLPAMHLVQLKIADLRAPQHETRKITEWHVQDVASGIQTLGFSVPVLVGKNNEIIDGLTSVKAAESLGLTSVPCVRIDHLSESEQRVLRLAINRLTEKGEWNFDALKMEFNDLVLLDAPLDLTGFTPDEITAITTDKTAGLTDPDDIPEVVNPVTQFDDVWLLGKHRLVCGDSTSAASVAKALNGVKPHLMVTDPPYGVKYNASWRTGTLREDGSQRTSKAIGKVLNDDKADWSEAWALFPGDVVYVWCASLYNDTVISSLEAADFHRRSFLPLKAEGASLRKIADALNARGIATARGGKWAATQVADILKRVAS